MVNSHDRHPSFVQSYMKSNGTLVSGHYRNGSSVRGFEKYSSFNCLCEQVGMRANGTELVRENSYGFRPKSCTVPNRLVELARYHGHPLTICVHCKFCGNSIWLHAVPNGGFVVFESLGVPWPKHDCRTSVVQKYLDYKIDSRFSPSYRFPVPESAEFNRPKDGAVLSGIIVDVLDPRQHVRHPGFFQDIVIYDGNQLFRVQLSHPEKLYLRMRGVCEGFRSGAPENQTSAISANCSRRAKRKRRSRRFAIG